MTPRSLALFIHVTSAMGLLGALGIEGALLFQLTRAATAAHVQAVLRGFRWVQLVGAVSLLATIASGIYLVVTVWGWQAAWIGAGFASLIVVALIGATTTGPRIARLGKSASDRTHSDPILWLRHRPSEA